ncbi:hypothetical protein VTO42DRAFT_1856 [Malbranchea cinnamomea]
MQWSQLPNVPRPVFKEVTNQTRPGPTTVEPIKRVQFADGETTSKSEPEPKTKTENLDSSLSSLLILKWKTTSDLPTRSTASFTGKAGLRYHKHSGPIGLGMRGDPILRRRKIQETHQSLVYARNCLDES